MAKAKKNEDRVDSTPWSVKLNTGTAVKTGFKSFKLANAEIKKISRETAQKGLETPILAAVRS